MPPWIYLLLAGAVLAFLGFAGVGSILLWIGLLLLVVGLALSIIGWAQRYREPKHSTTAPRAATAGQDDSSPRLSWERRAARLGWVAGALAGVAAVLLGLAIWTLATGRPDVVPSHPQRAVELIESAVLPVEIDTEIPGPRLASVIG